MHRFLYLLAAVLLVGTTRAADPLINYLPENAWMVVSLEDGPTSKANWDKSILKEASEDPDIRAFLKPMFESVDWADMNEEMEDEIGMTAQEVLGLVQGDMVVALTSMESLVAVLKDEGDDANGDFDEDVDAELADGGSSLDARPDYLVLATVKDKGPDAIKLLDTLFEDLEDEIWEADEEAELVMATTAFLGTDLKTYTVKRGDKTVYDFAYGVFDGRLVFGGPIKLVQDTATMITKGAPAKNLATNPLFVEARQTVGKHDMLMYMNLQVICQASTEYLEATLNAPEFQEGNMMGIMTKGVVDGIGLPSWRSMYMSMDISKRDPEMTVAIRYVDPVGLAKMFTYMKGGVAPRPKWIPATISEATVGYSDMAGMWGELKAIVAGVSPTVSMMALGQLQTIGAQMGVDFDADVMQKLGTEAFVLKQLRELKDGQIEVTTGDELYDQVIILSLKKDHAVGTQLAAVIGNVNAKREANGQEPLLQEMIGGNPVYTLDLGGQGPGQIHFTVQGNYLIFGIGDLTFTRNVLKWMNTPPATSIWDRPDVKAALATLPPNAHTITVSDVAQQTAGILEMLPILAGAIGDEVSDLVDLEATPSKATVTKYLNLGIAAGHIDDAGMVARYRMIGPAE